MRPEELQSLSPGPGGPPLIHSFSLLPCSFSTNRYMWSDRVLREWERSGQLLHHGGAQVLIGQINLPGEKGMQPSRRQGSQVAQEGLQIKTYLHWDLHQRCRAPPHLNHFSWGSFPKSVREAFQRRDLKVCAYRYVCVCIYVYACMYIYMYIFVCGCYIFNALGTETKPQSY